MRTVVQMRTKLDLPLHQSLAIVERQHHHHVLAHYGYRVRFLVQGKSSFQAQEMLQRQRCLCLTLFVTVF